MLTTLTGGEGVPPEPDWSTLFADELDLKIAREHWRTVVNEMREHQTLTVANGAAIKRLVMFHVEFERQARAVAEDGAIRHAKRTKVPQIHPAWSVMKQAAEAAASAEAELAISPRRRNNGGKVQRKAKRTTAADEFRKPVAARSRDTLGKASG
jgi:P27 family predicted phage terminase small subunit